MTKVKGLVKNWLNMTLGLVLIFLKAYKHLSLLRLAQANQAFLKV